MYDEGTLRSYLDEADGHIHDAEAILRDLGEGGSTRMRRMRAVMYVKALRRLRGLVAAHRALPWNQAAPAARTGPEAIPHRSMRWPHRARSDASEHECHAR